MSTKSIKECKDCKGRCYKKKRREQYENVLKPDNSPKTAGKMKKYRRKPQESENEQQQIIIANFPLLPNSPLLSL